MTQAQTYKISIQETGNRADSAAKVLLEKKLSLFVSREFLQESLKTGTILLQGKRIKPLVRVTLGEVLTFTEDFFTTLAIHQNYKKPQELVAAPQQIARTDGFVVISKPAGLLTHSFVGSRGEETLESWLQENIPETKELERAGIVHRLDRNTSGLILVATNDVMKETLKNLFQTRGVKKTYIALCRGRFKQQEGSIEAPLIRKKGSFKRLVAKNNTEAGAREACTEYRVIVQFDDQALVFVYPKTGRTHQIRAHMKALGHPVVGDTLYGGGKPEGLARQFLHAFQLEFNVGNEKMFFRDSLPEELADFLKTIDSVAVSRYDDEAFEGLFTS
jgi:23S rRNA pseudouridine1911/1915/1917 synthase